MKLHSLVKSTLGALFRKTGPLHCRMFQPDYAPRDPMDKPKRYKYPPLYDPYGPKPRPTDKVVKLAERIATLPVEEGIQFTRTLMGKLSHPKIQPVSMDSGSQSGSAKVEEKTAFDVKLEKLDAVVDKAPVTKEEANDIIDKLKAIGGVAVMME